MKKKQLTLKDKQEILKVNLDIIYKYCHLNKNKYKHRFENFEDFIAECMILIYDNIKYWEPDKGTLATFIYNWLSWRLKDKYQENTISLEESGESLEEEISLKVFQGEEEKRKDNQVLALITPNLHLYTKEHYVNQKTIEQIAQENKVTISSVKYQITKNLKALREKIKESGGEA